MKSACCSILLFAAAPLFAFAAEPASAPATRPYKGWVHVRYPAGNGVPASTSHVNTLTGASWSETKTPSETTLQLWNPVTHQEFDYHASTGLIRIGDYAPPESDLRASMHPWTTYQDVVDAFRKVLGDDIDLEKIAHHHDGGDDSYDFGDLARTSRAAPVSAILRQIPWIIWLDPHTRLIREALVDGRKQTLTYGGPDINSIYDLGAPHTAKVYDNRPTPQTLAVLDRLEHRMSVPFPDGIYIFFQQADTSASLETLEQSGKRWNRRFYLIRNGPQAVGTEDLPANWQGAGADEFFQRLATLDFYSYWSGDGIIVQARAPDETWPILTGERAAKLTKFFSVEHDFFAMQASRGRQGLDRHVDLITDPAHPGLIGLRLQEFGLTPDSSTHNCVEWIDAAHGDRLMQRIDENFELPAPPNAAADYVPPERYKLITDYTEFATLPAPDGRAYPTVWTQTAYKPDPHGSWGSATVDHHTFHYFSDRTLPHPRFTVPPGTPKDIP